MIFRANLPSKGNSKSKSYGHFMKQSKSPKFQDVLNNAHDCERMALLVHNPEIRSAYEDLARLWREVAQQIHHRERTGKQTTLRPHIAIHGALNGKSVDDRR